jgi:hypothetical protein
MAKHDTSRSALLTEDLLALLQSDEGRQVAETERILDRIYAIRLRKAFYQGRISANAMRQAGWQ